MNATNPSTISVESLAPVAYRGVPVITTDLLARCYDAKPIQIQQNYLNNAGRFAEERHLFKVEGADLRAMKTDSKISSQFEISKHTRSLVLWTARGAARHAKMLDTDKAWDMFEKLEDSYFRPIEAKPAETLDEIADRAAAQAVGDLLRKRGGPLSIREKRLLVAECRKINGVRAAQAMWKSLGLPGDGPGQLALPVPAQALKPGQGFLALADRVVMFDSNEFEMKPGEEAVVIHPDAARDNGPRVDRIDPYRFLRTIWGKRSSCVTPLDLDGRPIYRVAYVLGRVVQTLPA